MIYESEKNVTLHNAEKNMFLGECDAKLVLDKKGIYYIRVKDESFVDVEISNDAFALIYLYGNTTSAHIKSLDDKACAKIYRVHGMALEDTACVIKGVNDVDFN